MKKLLLLLFLIPNLVVAEAYLCEAEAAGGVVLDKDNRYRGTEFNVGNVKTIFKKDDKGFWIAHEFPEEDYSIKYSCIDRKTDNGKVFELVCQVPDTNNYWGEYRLYIPRLRYMSFRSTGWEGMSAEEWGMTPPSPHIIVGKCSKI